MNMNPKAIIFLADGMADSPLEELNKLTTSLVEGRKKVRDYQSMLKNIKGQLKETNRAYDLSKG